MRCEKDKRIGETLKMNVIVYVAFIGIALGLTARYCLANPPRYLIAAACFACGAYMGICLLRFARFLKTWESTFLQIDDDKASGVSIDPRKGTGEPFEIALADVEDVSLQQIKLTGRTPLPSLVIRTSSCTYRVIGIEDMKTARSCLLPNSDQF